MLISLTQHIYNEISVVTEKRIMDETTKDYFLIPTFIPNYVCLKGVYSKIRNINKTCLLYIISLYK